MTVLLIFENFVLQNIVASLSGTFPKQNDIDLLLKKTLLLMFEHCV